jgi:hypothetical protein
MVGKSGKPAALTGSRIGKGEKSSGTGRLPETGESRIENEGSSWISLCNHAQKRRMAFRQKI